MSEALRAAASELLASGEAAVVIGHEPGTNGRRRPLFARSAAEAQRLVHDDGCWHNLTVYLAKPEVRRLGRPAVVARPAALRSLLQLSGERQLKDGEVIALVVEASGVKRLSTLDAMRGHLAAAGNGLHPLTRAAIERLTAMTVAERRAFWEGELARCVKCYACRAACPMCYCERCTTECNRPQWIPVASHDLGNLQYHLMRAMHLAGRCVECASCFRACPEQIPVHLLATHAEESVRRQFGQGAGSGEYALSAFRPGDKESFIR